MESEGSLAYSQEPATIPYPKKDQPSSWLPIAVLEYPFNMILPFTPRSSKLSLSLRFAYQTPVSTSPLPHACHIPLQTHYS
jgi:hypothetical protein